MNLKNDFEDAFYDLSSIVLNPKNANFSLARDGANILSELMSSEEKNIVFNFIDMMEKMENINSSQYNEMINILKKINRFLINNENNENNEDLN